MKINIERDKEFDQDVWLILQKIRKEYLLATAEEKEKILFDVELTEKDARTTYERLSSDTQRKLLYLLREWRALDLRTSLTDESIQGPIEDTLKGKPAPSIETPRKPPTKFILAIKQPKFDELYHLYEVKFGYQSDKSSKILTAEKDPVSVKITNQFLNVRNVDSKDGEKHFPSKLPAGTQWEDVTIKFLDDENVLIQVRQFKHNANYEDMGFSDSRGKLPKPNVQWVFLRTLAKCNGEISIKDREKKVVYKKQKELLSEGLKSYFKIDYDPFYPYPATEYKTDRSYKIKIKLIPPPSDEQGASVIKLDRNQSQTKTKNLAEQAEEDFNEHSPQVPEIYR